MSKTIDKTKPSEEKKSLNNTQPSKKKSVSPATRVGMMPLPGQKNKDSFAEEQVKVGD
jgi:hypothetical protein